MYSLIVILLLLSISIINAEESQLPPLPSLNGILTGLTLPPLPVIGGGTGSAGGIFNGIPFPPLPGGFDLKQFTLPPLPVFTFPPIPTDFMKSGGFAATFPQLKVDTGDLQVCLDKAVVDVRDFVAKFKDQVSLIPAALEELDKQIADIRAKIDEKAQDVKVIVDNYLTIKQQCEAQLNKTRAEIQVSISGDVKEEDIAKIVLQVTVDKADCISKLTANQFGDNYFASLQTQLSAINAKKVLLKAIAANLFADALSASTADVLKLACVASRTQKILETWADNLENIQNFTQKVLQNAAASGKKAISDIKQSFKADSETYRTSIKQAIMTIVDSANVTSDDFSDCFSNAASLTLKWSLTIDQAAIDKLTRPLVDYVKDQVQKVLVAYTGAPKGSIQITITLGQKRADNQNMQVTSTVGSNSPPPPPPPSSVNTGAIIGGVVGAVVGVILVVAILVVIFRKKNDENV